MFIDARRDPHNAAHYVGLCRKTASIYENYVDEDYEDIVQILHIKCWKALLAYDPAKSRMTVEAYVFMCMKNQCKDLVKRRHRDESYIEDFRGPQSGDLDWFAFEMGLFTDHEQTFGQVDEGAPLVPSTLTGDERSILALLAGNYRQREVAEHLGMKVSAVERSVRSIRVKMADWTPTSQQSPALVALAA